MFNKNRKRLMGYGILSVIFGFIGLYMMTMNAIIFPRIVKQTQAEIQKEPSR